MVWKSLTVWSKKSKKNKTQKEGDMKKVIPVCFFIVLAISLLLIGLESGNAQVTTKGKPPKVEEKWSVTIAVDGNYNLMASNSSESDTYTDNAFVSVYVSPPSKQCACYGFHLRINRPADQKQGDYAIDFEDVGISDDWSLGEGTPCVLPGLVDNCVGEEECAPWCIADFLNNNRHPSPGYLRASIWIQLKSAFVDSLLPGDNGSDQMPQDSGFIYFSFYNGDPAIPEQSSETIYHEVYGFTTDLTGLWLTKESNGDKWIIEVVDQSLDLKEQYREEYPYYRGKKAKTGTKLLSPLEIVTLPVSFKMTWEKVQPN